MGNIVFYFSDEFRSSLPNRYYLLIIRLGWSISSFRDDIKNVNSILRLLIQFVCIYISLSCISLNQVDIPFKLSILIAFGTWVYITNITNLLMVLMEPITHVTFFYTNILISNLIGFDQIFSFYLCF